jgi:hypothetical protein
VLTGKVAMQVSSRGQDLTFTARSTAVYARQGGAWNCGLADDSVTGRIRRLANVLRLSSSLTWRLTRAVVARTNEAKRDVATDPSSVLPQNLLILP